jgi:hypothetical protein
MTIAATPDCLIPSKPRPPGLQRLGWSSRRECFRANLAALAQRMPSLAASIEACTHPAARYHLYLAPDQNFQIFDTHQNDPAAAWLGGLADHRKSVELFAYDKKTTPFPLPFAFDGIGFGWFLLSLLESTDRSFLTYSCAMYVVEPDLAALWLVFHLHDMQKWLRHPRLRIFGGGGAAEEFRASLHANNSWMLPQVFVRALLTKRPFLALQQIQEEMLSKRQKDSESLSARLKAMYAGKDQQYWRERFAAAGNGQPPLRVLGLTTRYSTVLQYSMAELKESVTAAGQIMEIAKEADDQALELPFLQSIESFKPDLLVQISRMRYENSQLPEEIPFLCWDQDNLPCMRTPQATASLDALTYVGGHGAVFGYTHLGWPASNCLFCHPAAMIHTSRSGFKSSTSTGPYFCDISFISNASGSPQEERDTIANTFNAHPPLRAAFLEAANLVIEASMQRGVAWEYVSLRSLIRQVETVPLGEAARHEMYIGLCRLADRCFRHAALAWVKSCSDKCGWTFKLCGSGWERHPLFAPHAAGPTRPGDGAAEVFRGSKINLQLFETGFIHSRSLDGIAAGGFFLTRATNMGADLVTVRAVFELACMEPDKRFASAEEVEHCTDPEIRWRWEKAKEVFRAVGGAPAALRAMPIWRRVPAAELVWPPLAKITFSDAQSFEKLAAQYLENDPLRLSVAGEMRDVLMRDFSYDARWKSFLAGIREGLEDRPPCRP